MNPYLLLAFVVSWGASVGGAGWYGMGLGEDKVTAQQARDDQVRRKTFNDAQAGAAAAIAANKPKNTTIVQKVQREVQTNTVYSDCRVPPAGMQLANRAITGVEPKPAGGGSVPSTDATH